MTHAAAAKVASADGNKICAGRPDLVFDLLLGAVTQGTIVMTAPTPMTMPNIVSVVRNLLCASALNATQRTTRCPCLPFPCVPHDETTG